MRQVNSRVAMAVSPYAAKAKSSFTSSRQAFFRPVLAAVASAPCHVLLAAWVPSTPPADFAAVLACASLGKHGCECSAVSHNFSYLLL